MMKHQATMQVVSLPTYENDLLSYIINDPTFVQKKYPYFMARIVHLEQFLKEYPFNYSKKSSINLFVTDDFLENNTGVYKISATEVAKINNIKSDNYLAIHIGDLTALLMEYKTVSDLKILNKIHGKEEDFKKLEAMLTIQPTYLTCFFLKEENKDEKHYSYIYRSNIVNA